MIEKVIEIILNESIYSAKSNSTIEIGFSQDKNEIKYYVQNISNYMEFQSIEENKKRVNFQEKNYAPGYYLAKEYIHAHFGRMIAECYPDKVHILGFYLPKK